MARTIANAAIWRFEIVLTPITVVITIVWHPKFLFFKVHSFIGFGKAIAPRNHDIFNPASSMDTQTSGE